MVVIRGGLVADIFFGFQLPERVVRIFNGAGAGVGEFGLVARRIGVLHGGHHAARRRNGFYLSIGVVSISNTATIVFRSGHQPLAVGLFPTAFSAGGFGNAAVPGALRIAGILSRSPVDVVDVPIVRERGF